MKNREKSLIGMFVALLAVPAMLLTCATPPAFATAADEETGTSRTIRTAGATAGKSSNDKAAAGKSGGVSDGAVTPVVDGSDTDGAGTSDGAGNGNDTATVAGPVPNIIITNFSYGDKSVPAGSNFTLSFTFQNMGKVAVDNLVVTVDGGDSLAISGGTNTFYFDALGAGWAMTQSVPMQALPSAASGAQGVSVGFKYEYVDGGARSSNSSDIKISVPVSQPDRFELNDPVLPDGGATVGSETTITMNYVNKGKGDIANVEASIEGEGLQATNAKQYVGNVASGATGSIGFAFTPTQSGDISATLRVTYEDPDGNTQKKEFPVTVTASDAAPMDPDDGGMVVPDDTTQQGVPGWVWAVVAVVVVAGVITTVMLVRRRRRKAKQTDIDEEWDDWTGGAAGAHDAHDAASGKSSTDTADLPVVGTAAATGDAVTAPTATIVGEGRA
ncbi:ABC transporter permease [Bifidobacterium ramosum]|uniref:ABC transporter permease n=1 Tax=Bifidobacterium ramosum TaxID=1798158 RepID=A0A6L4X133_9BIFI|nr:ABC transporter permease [Bifidobacterium ramosum]KAB8287878.1 ABC transporter permease [Bifidobacterium ramosum]NEG71173.1 ABC transporter permease [Bifidobacterium ramosum]